MVALKIRTGGSKGAGILSRAPLNVAQMVMEMNAKTIPNGVMIDTVYADTSSEGDYDRKEIGWLFDVLN